MAQVGRSRGGVPPIEGGRCHLAVMTSALDIAPSLPFAVAVTGHGGRRRATLRSSRVGQAVGDLDVRGEGLHSGSCDFNDGKVARHEKAQLAHRERSL
eukprot:scaffold19271_cov28-Tisochrysis_lutea.AAC.6